MTARVWDAGTGEPVTPPLKHSESVHHASFSPDGRRVVTVCNDRAARVWEVSPDERPVDDLVLLAQLLASQRVDPTGALETIDTETLHVIWDTLRSKYPSDFVASP